MTQPIPSGVPADLYPRLHAYVRDRLSGHHGYSDLVLHNLAVHCNGAALGHPAEEAADYHHHEHYGPGGLRNHDYDDHSWDIERAIRIIIESAEMDLSSARDEHLDLHKWQDAIDDLMDRPDANTDDPAAARGGDSDDQSEPGASEQDATEQDTGAMTGHASAQAFLDDLLPAPFARTLAMLVDADEPPVTLCSMDALAAGAAKQAVIALRQCLLLVERANTPSPVFEFIPWATVTEVSARDGMLRIATTMERAKVITSTDSDDGGLAALSFAAHLATYLPTPQPAAQPSLPGGAVQENAS